MKSEFEKHYLDLGFYTKCSAQICLDACTFDVKQDAYLPSMDWILENDEDECVAYCLMLNTAYLSFKHQQSKVDELQKRVDAALKVAQSIRKEIEHGHLSDDESQTLSSYANDLEQAFKGGCDASN